MGPSDPHESGSDDLPTIPTAVVVNPFSRGNGNTDHCALLPTLKSKTF